MIKIFLLSGILLISGCHLEKSYISPLGVAIQDNAPCFFVPPEIVKSLRLAENRGIYVSRKTAQHWVFFGIPRNSPYCRELLRGVPLIPSD